MNRSTLHDLFVKIRNKRGRLTPQVIVKEAENPRHPLHNEFDWDDASAAHKHRLQHAARLIRLVKIKVVLPSGPTKVRQWHAVRAAGVVDAPAGYVMDEEVAATPMFREAMLRQMERDWRALESRYQHLKEFWDMIKIATKKRGRRRAG